MAGFVELQQRKFYIRSFYFSALFECLLIALYLLSELSAYSGGLSSLILLSATGNKSLLQCVIAYIVFVSKRGIGHFLLF